MSILSELQSKKLGLLELISLGYDLYLKKIRLFLSLNCIALPFFIIISVLGQYGSTNFYISFLSILYVVFYLFVFLQSYSAAINILVENCVLREKTQLKDVVRQISHRILPVISLHIRFSLNLFLRFLLLIVPGIIYSINNGFFIQALILRDQRGKAAFQYSRSLVKGNWWRVFFYGLLGNLTTFGLLSIFNKILSSTIPNSPILASVLSNILMLLASFGVSISGVLLFLNLEFQNGSEPRLSHGSSEATEKL